MKTAVITGATNGMGYETALALAKLNYHVVVIGRNETKVNNTVSNLQTQSNNPHIVGYTCNLANTLTIKNLADKLFLNHEKVDILINNAGAYISDELYNSDGMELTMATNHVPYVYLTQLLMPALLRAPAARVINVASEAQKYGSFNPKQLFKLNSYSAMKAYGNSKLYNIMFSLWLANELNNTNITVNTLHPGGVNSGFAKDATGLTGFIFKKLAFMLRSAQKGAETIIWLASSNEVNGISGKYFYDKKEIKAQADAYNKDYQQLLMDETNVYINKCNGK